MHDPDRDPDLSDDPVDSNIDPNTVDNDTDAKESPAALDDASLDARNGAVGGTDGITKDQDDIAQ